MQVALRDAALGGKIKKTILAHVMGDRFHGVCRPENGALCFVIISLPRAAAQRVPCTGLFTFAPYQGLNMKIIGYNFDNLMKK